MHKPSLRFLKAALVKIARDRKGINQKDLSEQLEIQQSMLSMVERGKRPISKSLLVPLCNALDLMPPAIYKINEAVDPSRPDWWNEDYEVALQELALRLEFQDMSITLAKSRQEEEKAALLESVYLSPKQSPTEFSILAFEAETIAAKYRKLPPQARDLVRFIIDGNLSLTDLEYCIEKLLSSHHD